MTWNDFRCGYGCDCDANLRDFRSGFGCDFSIHSWTASGIWSDFRCGCDANLRDFRSGYGFANRSLIWIWIWTWTLSDCRCGCDCDFANHSSTGIGIGTGTVTWPDFPSDCDFSNHSSTGTGIETVTWTDCGTGNATHRILPATEISIRTWTWTGSSWSDSNRRCDYDSSERPAFRFVIWPHHSSPDFRTSIGCAASIRCSRSADRPRLCPQLPSPDCPIGTGTANASNWPRFRCAISTGTWPDSSFANGTVTFAARRHRRPPESLPARPIDARWKRHFRTPSLGKIAVRVLQ